MDYELLLANGDDEQPSLIEVADPYMDLVYGPLVGATALLILRYLHASIPLRASPLCSLQELAEATGSRPRRMAGPLGRLERHRLIVIQRPETSDPDQQPLGRIVLPARVPQVSEQATKRLGTIGRLAALSRRQP